jgi:hypothetical protein
MEWVRSNSLLPLLRSETFFLGDFSKIPAINAGNDLLAKIELIGWGCLALSLLRFSSRAGK